MRSSARSKTTSGGACVNACALQGALPSLGFGEVGMSGSGRHHGVEGFREFSSSRGRRGARDGRPGGRVATPYGAVAQAIVDSVFNDPEQADPAAPGGT